MHSDNITLATVVTLIAQLPSERRNKVIRGCNNESARYLKWWDFKYDDLKRCIRARLQVPHNRTICPTTNLFTDLGADSLDIAELYMDIEDESGMMLPIEKAHVDEGTVYHLWQLMGKIN